MFCSLVVQVPARGTEFWDISHYFLAYVDCAAGALHVNQGRLVYP